jgi:hypothetical protein
LRHAPREKCLFEVTVRTVHALSFVCIALLSWVANYLSVTTPVAGSSNSGRRVVEAEPAVADGVGEQDYR